MNTLTCPECHARIQAAEPKIVIINHPDRCVIVMDTVRVRCPNPLCVREYISAIAGCQLQTVWPPAPADEKRIIVPNLVMPKDIKGG